MRRLLVASAALLFVAPAAAALDRSDFRYTRELSEPGLQGVLSFEPDGPLFAHTRPGFADLRIVDEAGREAPWRTLPRPQGTRPTSLSVLNSGRRAGRAVALLDLGPRRRVHDRIELDVPDTGFVGRVEISGSDDRRTFTRLSTTAIYDIEGAEHARSTTVVYPPSDFRFLAVRATGVSAIQGATISGSAGKAALLARSLHGLERRAEARRSVLTADLGFRNLPVDRLELTAEGRYDRPVIVEGSNNGRTWVELARGRIARFPNSVLETAIELAARHRYVRVTIRNGDDAPLDGLDLAAFARSRALVVSDGFTPPFRLLYGAARVGSPVYDFARLPRSALRVAGAGSLGPERSNASFEPPEDTRSFAARHPKLLQAALGLVAIVVAAGGFLALRRRT